jgi:hypothetical protein
VAGLVHGEERRAPGAPRHRAFLGNGDEDAIRPGAVEAAASDFRLRARAHRHPSRVAIGTLPEDEHEERCGDEQPRDHGDGKGAGPMVRDVAELRQ